MAVLLRRRPARLPGPPARRAARRPRSPSARGCVHLTPGTVDLEVTERFEDRPDLTGAVKPTRVHLWQLHTEGLDLRIDGTEVVHTGVETGPDRQRGARAGDRRQARLAAAP